MSNKRVLEIIVAKDVANSIEVLKMEGTSNLVTLGATDTVKDSAQIYFRQIDPNNVFRYSLPVAGKYVKSYKGEPYRPAVPKKMAVGYNGTTGSLPVINNAEYLLNLVVQTDKEEVKHIQRFSYVSDATATQAEIATGLALAVNTNDYAKYQGITATTINDGAGNYGLVLTGTVPGVPNNGYAGVGPMPINSAFYIAIDGAFGNTPGSTLITVTQQLDEGAGTPTVVRYFEEEAKGNKGYLNRINLPQIPTYFTDLGTNYDMIVIEHSEDHDEQYINDSKKAPVTLMILIPDGTLTNFNKTAFLTALDSYMGSVGFPAAGI